MKNLTLITGGARSGKSSLAEKLACEKDLKTYYLATMPPILNDKEQSTRIERHRARRPTHWQTIESPLDAAKEIQNIAPGPACVIMDCLSLFITNIMLIDGLVSQADPYQKESAVTAAIQHLLSVIEGRSDLEIIVVTNEVGLGVVPETNLGRAFRDFLGQSNQLFAGAAQTVHLCCVGLSLTLKS